MKKIMMIFLLTGCNQTVSVYVEQDIKSDLGVTKARAEYRIFEKRAKQMEDYEDYLIDGVGFADPGGRSALRAATRNNPRIYPCPTCGRKNMLTKIDVQRHYQCDRCADAAEMGIDR